MNYVYSTITCPTSYVKYKELSAFEAKDSRGASAGHNEVLKRVVIKGGHGLADKHLFTPHGVVTQVSDEDMQFLLENESFKKHVKDGFITFDKKKSDPEKKAKNMADKDRSAPLTPKDFEKGENDSEEVRIYKGIARAKMN